MKNLKVDVKLKNNILHRAIYDNYGTIANFCRLYKKIRPTHLFSLLNLQMSPIRVREQQKRQGKPATIVEFRTVCENLSLILGIPVETLFPIELYQIKQTKLITEINFSDLPYLIDRPLSATTSNPYQEIEKREQAKELLRILTKKLTPKELQVMKMRWGLADETEHTLNEIGQKFNRTKERIRQIEAKAIKKLQHCNSKRQLKKIYL